MEWLGQVLVHARRQAALAIALHGVSGKRDDGNMFASLLFFFADRGRSRKTVHFRHLNVHENEVEGLIVDLSQSLMAVGRNYRFVPHGFEHMGDHLLVDCIGLSHEDAQGKSGIRRTRASSDDLGMLLRAAATSHRKIKSAAFSRDALHPQVAAHHLHQAARNRQSQPSSAERARNTVVGLRKSLEDHLALVGGNSDAGVRHAEL